MIEKLKMTHFMKVAALNRVSAEKIGPSNTINRCPVFVEVEHAVETNQSLAE